MKFTFLLDENIVRFALEGNVGAIELVQRIGKNCHRLTFCHELWEKYRQHFSHRRSDPRIRRLIDSIMRNSLKLEYVLYTDPIEGEESLPRKDVYLVRLAASSQATLVTEDGPLREALTHSTPEGRAEIRVVPLEEGLTLALETNEEAHGRPA